jgi:NAD(P)-dependent dehydrogenase (short-subunit alcohol dehydrogenase family)
MGSKEKELHVLFNNGFATPGITLLPALNLFLNSGLFKPPIEQLTVDGYDLQFGTNVLGMDFLDKLIVI